MRPQWTRRGRNRDRARAALPPHLTAVHIARLKHPTGALRGLDRRVGVVLLNEQVCATGDVEVGDHCPWFGACSRAGRLRA